MTEKERVAEHLNTLSILYYVYAALHAFGMCFGGVYIAMGGLVAAAIKADATAPEEAKYAPGIVVAFGSVVFLVALTGAVCAFLSGRWLRRRRNRTFSQVVAGVTCLGIPLGTALGVCTFVVLGKPEAEELYREAQTGGPPPVA